MALALLSMASTVSAANYNVNNTTYMNVFTSSGIADTFDLGDGNGSRTFQVGDTFTFLSGVYNSTQIVLDKTVNLIGNGALLTNPTQDFVINILETALYSNITGFNINGYLNVSADNVTLNNNSIKASSKDGIIINSNNVTISNNRISDSAFSGINTAGNNTHIINNTLRYNKAGITSTGNNTTITGNSIYYYNNNSSINSTGADAIITNNKIFRNFLVNNTTYTNIFTSTGIASTFNLDGVDYDFQDGDTFTFLEGLYENVKIILDKPVSLLTNGSVNLTGNNSSNDIIQILNTANNSNVTGFNINGSVNISASNATLNNSTLVSSSRDGILITGHNVTVSGNTLRYANQSGIKSTGDNNTIKYNNIYSSGTDGIHVLGKKRQFRF